MGKGYPASHPHHHQELPLPHARLALAAALALVTLTGCKPDSAVRNGTDVNPKHQLEPQQAGGVPVDPATIGTVTGTVHLSGKAPERVRIDMSQDPVCSVTGGDNFSEQFVVDHGNLANVYLFVKAGPPAAMNAAPTGPIAPRRPRPEGLPLHPPRHRRRAR